MGSLGYPVLDLDFSAKQRLAEKLKKRKSPLSFEEDPVLAALCTCVGLQHELGKKGIDRLSLFFGRDPHTFENPWQSQIIVKENKVGLRLLPVHSDPLEIRHEDFKHILSPECFDEAGNLSQIVIYPYDVWANYKRMGFDLVIVPDWLRTSALEETVNYFYANSWEVDSNIAATQIELMCHRRIPFSGTHDIVDHLLGADLTRYLCCEAFLLKAKAVYQNVFPVDQKPKPGSLLLSYLIGVLLDDMAQPKWYGSKTHLTLLENSLKHLAKSSLTLEKKNIPQSFHRLMEKVRAESQFSEISLAFLNFLNDLN